MLADQEIDNGIRDDTWFLQAEQAAWEDWILDQINFELAELACSQSHYETV